MAYRLYWAIGGWDEELNEVRCGGWLIKEVQTATVAMHHRSVVEPAFNLLYGLGEVVALDSATHERINIYMKAIEERHGSAA